MRYQRTEIGLAHQTRFYPQGMVDVAGLLAEPSTVVGQAKQAVEPGGWILILPHHAAIANVKEARDVRSTGARGNLYRSESHPASVPLEAKSGEGGDVR